MAETLAKQERDRREYDRAFSGYADAYIYPAGTDLEDYDPGCTWRMKGYIVYR